MSTSRDSEKDVDASASPNPEPEKAEVGFVQDVKNADAALEFLRHEGEVREMTKEDEKKLLRKIDFMIMPLMWCCYCLQYLDKTLINYAAVMVRTTKRIKGHSLIVCRRDCSTMRTFPTANSVHWH